MKRPPLPPGAPDSSRLGFVDYFRGLLMAHMALDHASLFFNPGKFGNEFAAGAMPVPSDFWQFITRFTGVFVAPGFSFMAGFMVAVTSASREERGRDSWSVTRKLIVRGLVLIAAEAIVFGLPMGHYSFEVLSCLGVCLIITALVRQVPTSILLPVALCILALHQRLDLSGLPDWLRRVLHEPSYERGAAFKVLYPVIPWIGIMLVGLVVGRAARARHAVPAWMILSVASFVLFFVIRLAGGYGNTWAHSGIASYSFWTFAKYPPDLPWITFSFGVIFALLAFLKTQQDHDWMRFLAPVRTIGRVPFFFYLLHFIVLFVAAMPFAKNGKVPLGLGGAYIVWIVLVAGFLVPCAWYYRMKTERPNVVTQYL